MCGFIVSSYLILNQTSRNTGVAIDTVNFVWTFGFLGYLVGSLLTGLVFKQFIRTAGAKLTFLFLTICVTGVRISTMLLWRYRYRFYRTDQHRTGTDNYRYSNGQRFRVYWLYWVISGYIYRTGKL